ncbi:MAG: hypothetical protein M3N53_04785 [Actinomycetota bacterium]|nr:hypothetical protein [Actinomycetota bacterium]
MLLDLSLRATMRNFSTLFLVVFIALAPLHLAYGLVFHDVLELRELHPAINAFPPSRLVRGVGRAALAQAAIWFWILALIEVLAIPVFLRVSRDVLSKDGQGEVPTALGAWRSIRQPAEIAIGTITGSRGAAVAGGSLIAIVVGALVQMIGMTVVDLLPDSVAFAAIPLTQAAAHSAGAPFFLVALTYALAAAGTAPAERLPDLF